MPAKKGSRKSPVYKSGLGPISDDHFRSMEGLLDDMGIEGVDEIPMTKGKINRQFLNDKWSEIFDGMMNFEPIEEEIDEAIIDDDDEAKKIVNLRLLEYIREDKKRYGARKNSPVSSSSSSESSPSPPSPPPKPTKGRGKKKAVPKKNTKKPIEIETNVSDLSKLKVAELKKMAEDKDLEVNGTGKAGRVLKADYIRALQDDDSINSDEPYIELTMRKSASPSSKTSRCWPGYEPVPGKAPYSKGSCRKSTSPSPKSPPKKAPKKKSTKKSKKKASPKKKSPKGSKICGEEENKCDDDKICRTTDGKCISKTKAGRPWGEAKLKEAVKDYFYDSVRRIAGERSDVEAHISHWKKARASASKSPSPKSASPKGKKASPEASPKKKAAPKKKAVAKSKKCGTQNMTKKDLDDMKECDDDQVCNVMTGRCVKDTPRNTKGKQILKVNGRVIIGEPSTIATLQKALGGTIEKPEKAAPKTATKTTKKSPVKPKTPPKKAPKKKSPPKKSKSSADDMREKIKQTFHECLSRL